MHTFEVHIATEDGELFFGQADSVTVSTLAGYITVLPNHVPIVSVVAPGVITVRANGGEQTFPSEHGIIDVRPEKVIILLHNGDRA
jgi:F-type H+-transporting ATPase subunit epsilon